MAGKNNRKRKRSGKKQPMLSTAELLQSTRLFLDSLPENNPPDLHSPFDGSSPGISVNHLASSTSQAEDFTGIQVHNEERQQNEENQQHKLHQQQTLMQPYTSMDTDGTTVSKPSSSLSLDEIKQAMGSTFTDILKHFSADEPPVEENEGSDSDFASSDEEEDWEKESSSSDEENNYEHAKDMSYDDYADYILSRLSRKRLKKLARPTMAELKLWTNRPEVVEQHDENSPDPLLLIHLKSYRNTVPVPLHWSLDRKYLSSKRGYEKPPFELPDFIKDTGIQEIREKYEKKLEGKSAKAIAKERMRAKLTKSDIDYQVLHDAFFKYSKKPPLTIHGDIYYEGKENLIHAKQFKPGELSEELKAALGIPEGAPPPWLINMQKIGPPPSYPYLKIPGLNAPIPAGCKWGFHPGGWGKPPLDSSGKPLYGDVFGDASKNAEKKLEIWGEMVEDEESSEDEFSSEDEEDEDTVPQSERSAQQQEANTTLNPKSKEIVITTTTRSVERPKELMTVLKEESVSVVDQEGILNSEKRYILPQNYIRNSAISAPEFSAEISKSSEEVEMKEFMEQKNLNRQNYVATEDEVYAAEEESRKRKRKDLEKEKARKKLKL